jgi:hypothetical protein
MSQYASISDFDPLESAPVMFFFDESVEPFHDEKEE